MVVKRGRPEREQADIDATRIGVGSGTQDLANDKIKAIEPAFRPLRGSRLFRDQPASREPTAAWRVAASHASAHESTDDLSIARPDDQLTSGEPTVAASPARARQRADEDGVAPVHRPRNGITLLGVVFAVGIVSGVGATSMLAPGLGQTVRSLASALSDGVHKIASSRESSRSDGGASIEGAMARVTHASNAVDPTAKETSGDTQPYGDFSEQLAAIRKFLETPQTAPPLPPSIIADDVAVLSAEDEKTGDPAQSEATSPSHPVQLTTIIDTAEAPVIEEAAEADRAQVNAGRSSPGDSAVPSEQRRLPAQGQPTSNEARLRRAFEQFLDERRQAPVSPRDRETLFLEFRNALANALPRAAAPTSASKEGTRRVWQALETTNLHEFASAESTVIRTIAKGSTFRVIDRSKDGRWLKIETGDASTGYYWAARAREMP